MRQTAADLFLKKVTKSNPLSYYAYEFRSGRKINNQEMYNEFLCELFDDDTIKQRMTKQRKKIILDYFESELLNNNKYLKQLNEIINDKIHYSADEIYDALEKEEKIEIKISYYMNMTLYILSQ